MHLVLTLLLQGQTPATPSQPGAPPVSLDRIRRGLEEPTPTVTVSSSNPDLPPVFRMEVNERQLEYEHLWLRDFAPAYVRPTRPIDHHEFLEQVTPDLFRGTAMHPCCPVLPGLDFLRRKLTGSDGNQSGESKARRQVKKALAEFLEAQKTEKR
jgi:hypothetical protein